MIRSHQSPESERGDLGEVGIIPLEEADAAALVGGLLAVAAAPPYDVPGKQF